MASNKLTKRERLIEKALVRGDFKPVSPVEFQEIAEAVARRRKDTVLNIRVNKEDLDRVRKKAEKLGIRYQTIIAELIHRVGAS